MTKVKTKVGELKYVYINGEGRNTAMPGEEPRMRYQISWVVPEDSEEHKHLQALVDEEWANYKAENKVKGKPHTNGIKQELINDPSNEIDPDTEKVRKIPSGNIIATFSTNVVWPDGKPQEIKVYDPKGSNITGAIEDADFKIGNGSRGIVFGSAVANNIGGKHKVSLYLTGIQLAKLVKYMGQELDVDEIDGEEFDITGEGEEPDL
nr:MAG TPA: DNA helix destabilizing protein [Caudoviricetes sp.]